MKIGLVFGVIFSSLAFSAELDVSFNRIQHETYWDTYRGYERSGHNVEADIVALIDSATARVWMAVYELRLPLIAKALRSAKQRGVDVKIVTEDANTFLLDKLSTILPHAGAYEESRLKDYFAFVDLNRNNRLETSELAEMDALKIIHGASIPLIDDTEDGQAGSGLMHHKFIVIDNEIVFTGSGNFTWSDLHGDKLNPRGRGNANNFLKIENRKINKDFAEEFSQMWGDGPGGLKDSKFGVNKKYRAAQTVELTDGTKITYQFGATSEQNGWAGTPNGLIAKHLKKLTTSLEAAFFVWSEQKLADVIPQSLASNVSILIDPFFGYRPYSEVLDLLGVEMLDENCKLERDNRPWTQTADRSGIVQLTSGDLLHHKFAVLDSAKVITGSHNWSANANNNNDEVVLVIESPTVAGLYHDEFKRLEAHATVGLNSTLKAKLKEANEHCSTSRP